MTELTPDEARLRAAEGQMRRALGLQHEPAQSPAPKTVPAGANPQRRHFVRDGDVPVTIVHGERGNSLVQQMDAARQALRAQSTSFEEAERALAEARNTIGICRPSWPMRAWRRMRQADMPMPSISKSGKRSQLRRRNLQPSAPNASMRRRNATRQLLVF